MLKKRNEFQERYDKLKQDLLREIQDGKLAPGDYFLPERVLSLQYNLSHMSVRKLLAELQRDNLIEKIPGKGNRVPLSLQRVQRAQPVTLRIACYDDSHERHALSLLLQKYEKQNPNVKVELLPIYEGGYVNSLTTIAKNGDAPDVWCISDLHFRVLQDRGASHLLAPLAPAEMDVDQALYTQLFPLFSDSLDNPGSSTLRAVPFVFSPVVFCFNKTMIEEQELPQLANWGELLDLAERHTLHDEDGGIQQYGYGFSISNHRWPIYLRQNGGGFISDLEDQPLLSQPTTVEAFQFCLDLMYKHQVSPVFLQGNTRFVENLFMKNKVALITSTYYFMNEFMKSGIEWDVAPVIPGNTQQASLLLGAGMAIHSGSPNIPEAKRLIRFLIGSDAQTEFKRQGCTIPARRSVAEDETLYDPLVHPRTYHFFKHVMPFAYGVGELNMSPSRMERLQEELFLMWMNMEKPEAACRRIEQEWMTMEEK